MSFDPMAAAVDWLDAYRAGDIETILEMYARDAEIHCGCDGMKTISDADGRRAYWLDRLRTCPALDLDNLQPWEGAVVLSYVTRAGIVSTSLTFDSQGKITSQVCGRSN